MSEQIIIAENLVKQYKLYNNPKDRLKEALFPFIKPRHILFNAINGISFSINKGDTIGIIGKNGSGKSTLLKIITGVIHQTFGNIHVNGKIAALLELGAGFNPEMTGVENIYLNGIVTGYSRKDIDGKLKEIIDFADIGEYIYQPVKTYSSGMFARLAFSVAINVEPDILIVDEALAVGDMSFQVKCFKKFKDFKEQNKTILFVSHDLSSVLKMCDKCILLSHGQIKSQGDTKQVVDDYKKILAAIEEDNVISDTVVKIDNNSIIWKEKIQQNPEYSEYGNKRITIIDYGIFDINDNSINIISNDEVVKIKMKVQINDNSIEYPIFAFTIRDFHGNDICGTNTLYENIDTTEFINSKVLVIEFQQKLALKSGKYTISFGTTQFTEEKLEVFHRLYDMCLIEVHSVKNLVGIFDIGCKIKVNKIL